MPAFFAASRTIASRQAVTERPDRRASSTKARFTSPSTQHASCFLWSARFGAVMRSCVLLTLQILAGD